jgi:hypothetical protein
MALISCAECNKQMSAVAPNCPHCGHPNAAAAAAGADQAKRAGLKQRNAQATGKSLKLQGLLATLLLAASLVYIFSAPERPVGGAPLFAYLSMVIAMVWLLITKALVWWHHK